MKNIVVTGSTKGIGKALSTEFAKRGYNVAITGRNQADVDQAVKNLQAVAGSGARVIGVPTEVTDFASVQSLWDRVAAEFGSVDLWINNAGLAVMTKKVVDIDPSDIERMVRTNMLGTMYGTKVAVTGMTAQPNGGRVVNVLGGGSDGRIQSLQTVYSSTKRGLDLFTRAMVKETKGTNVLIQSIRPGILITDGFVREIGVMGPEDFKKWRKALNILGDHPEDVAPWLVDHILAMRKSGQHVQWLTNAKIARRFSMAGFKKRDLFARYGL